MRKISTGIILAVGLFVTGSLDASAVIEFGNPTTGACAANCENNNNWPHSVTGTNRAILVFVQGYGPGCTYNVLYDNTALTLVAESDLYDSSSFKTYAYAMVDPPTSATGVSISSNCGYGAGAVSYSGVDQVDMISTTSSGTSPTYVVASATTTTEVANALVISGHGQESSTITWTPGSGQIERVDHSEHNRSINVTDMYVADAETTVQMTSTPSDMSQETGSVVLSLKPAS